MSGLDLPTLLVKMSQGQKLGLAETQALANNVLNLQNMADVVSGWLGGNALPPHFNTLYANTLQLGSLPGDACQLELKAAQSIGNAAWTQVVFNSQTFTGRYNYKTQPFWSSANPGRITIPAGLSGLYLITAECYFDLNATGTRLAQVYINGLGTTYLAATPGNATWYGTVNISGLVWLNQSDYLLLYVYQNSGGALNLDVSSYFGILKVK